MFTRLAWIIAWASFLFGAIGTILAFDIALIDDPQTRAELSSRYLVGATTGQYIDKSRALLVFGIVLGAALEAFDKLSRGNN
jgi:hypothetical protein